MVRTAAVSAAIHSQGKRVMVLTIRIPCDEEERHHHRRGCAENTEYADNLPERE